MSAEIQYSVHAPNAFITRHLDQLLPNWSQPVRSVLLILQRCPIELVQRSHQAEANKNQLRDRFFLLGGAIVQSLRTQGFLAELFDPRTGLPIGTTSGAAALDDVAIAHAMLGYATSLNQGCQCLIHPHWGQAVYPSTILSSASPEQARAIAWPILNQL